MVKREKTQKITSIGGQALMEGIMMRGPLKTTVGVRKNDGSIELEEIQPLNLTQKYKLLRLPILRGVAGMIDSLVTGNKALMLSADKAMEGEEVPEEELSKFDKWVDKHFGEKAVSIVMGASVVFAVAICIAVFFFVPTFLFNLLSSALPFLNDHMIWRSAFEGILRIILFLVYMALVTLNKTEPFSSPLRYELYCSHADCRYSDRSVHSFYRCMAAVGCEISFAAGYGRFRL